MNKEIEYLKGHLYEIYKYKKSMKDLTYDMDLEHLLRTCKVLDYSQKEIERLNEKIDALKIEISSLMSRYFYEEDFYIEDAHLDKLLRIIDNDIELKGSDKNDRRRNDITNKRFNIR